MAAALSTEVTYIMPEEPETTETGGQGAAGEEFDKHRARGLAVTLDQAARHEWPVTEEMRRIGVAASMWLIAEGRTRGQGRLVAAGVRGLVSVDKINVQRESNQIARERGNLQEPSQHVHFHALNEGRDLISEVLAELKQQPEVPDNGRAGSNGSGRGNGHTGGNGSKPTP